MKEAVLVLNAEGRRAGGSTAWFGERSISWLIKGEFILKDKRLLPRGMSEVILPQRVAEQVEVLRGLENAEGSVVHR